MSIKDNFFYLIILVIGAVIGGIIYKKYGERIEENLKKVRANVTELENK